MSIDFLLTPHLEGRVGDGGFRSAAGGRLASPRRDGSFGFARDRLASTLHWLTCPQALKRNPFRRFIGTSETRAFSQFVPDAGATWFRRRHGGSFGFAQDRLASVPKQPRILPMVTAALPDYNFSQIPE